MMASASQRQPAQYPDPITVPPRSGQHTQSFIILHGRGSNGDNFGRVLLETRIPGFATLQEAFPHAKFIFPTAAKRRAQIWNRIPIHQWFDNWSLQAPTEREELQFDGLRESATFLHRLLRGEIEAVGAKNVVLWGLSQGSATTLITLLLWEGERFAAAVGMCGWLPLCKRMEDTLGSSDRDGEYGDEDDPFARERSSPVGFPEETSKINKVVEYLRGELDLSPSCSDRSTPSAAVQTPIFLGHGTEDEKVPVGLGQEAADLLRQVEIGVEYQEYAGLAHWYSGAMLGDIVCFIERRAGWTVTRA